MSENRQSVLGRRIRKLPLEPGEETLPGDFAWDTDMPDLYREENGHRFMFVHLPGESRWSAIRVCRGASSGARVWGWDGNEDAPTLTPSIHNPGAWHGYLRAGFFQSV